MIDVGANKGYSLARFLETCDDDALQRGANTTCCNAALHSSRSVHGCAARLPGGTPRATSRHGECLRTERNKRRCDRSDSHFAHGFIALQQTPFMEGLHSPFPRHGRAKSAARPGLAPTRLALRTPARIPVGCTTPAPGLTPPTADPSPRAALMPPSQRTEASRR